MPLQSIPWTIAAGASRLFTLELTADDDMVPPTPLDVSSATTIRWLAKRFVSDPDALALIAKDKLVGITVVDATHGVIQVQLVPLDTWRVRAVAVEWRWACKVFFSQTNQAIGAIGTLTVAPSAASSVTP